MFTFRDFLPWGREFETLPSEVSRIKNGFSKMMKENCLSGDGGVYELNAVVTQFSLDLKSILGILCISNVD